MSPYAGGYGGLDFGELDRWSHAQLKEYQKELSQYVAERFPRASAVPSYDGLDRALTDDQLRRLFKAAPNPTVKLAFAIAFFAAARVGELGKMEVMSGIDKLRIGSPEDATKNGTVDYLPLYEPLRSLLRHLDEVRNLSPHYVRKRFRMACKKAGPDLSTSHATAKRTGRKLYAITFHSLRFAAIDVWTEKQPDPFKQNQFSRHDGRRQLGVITVYRRGGSRYKHEEFKRELEEAFRPYRHLVADLL